MSDTFQAVAEVIAEVSDIDAGDIKPDSHTVNDLGIDSLDFLDITYAINKQFGINMPVEQWMEDINDGKADAEAFFVMENLCARIDELVAAKES